MQWILDDERSWRKKLKKKKENVSQPNAVFDDSCNFLLFTTFLGIKSVNLHANKVARILGKVENNERFLRIALYQGGSGSKKVKRVPAAAANVMENREPFVDPTVLCCAFKKHRIYLFRCMHSPKEIFILCHLIYMVSFNDVFT